MNVNGYVAFSTGVSKTRDGQTPVMVVKYLDCQKARITDMTVTWFTNFSRSVAITRLSNVYNNKLFLKLVG